MPPLDRRRFAQALCALPVLGWGGSGWANIASTQAEPVPMPAQPETNAEVARVLREAEDLERKIQARREQPFAASQSEVVVVLSGVVDLALVDRPGTPPLARLLGYVDLVVDVVAASVAGEVYDLVVESGDFGGLPGEALAVEGHIFDAGSGQVGAWIEAPQRQVGRPTLATRVGLKAELALRGGAAPRVAYGAVAGTFSTPRVGRKALVGAAALWEVSPQSPG